MELDELLDREGLDPDELMTWATRRAEQLLAELVGGSADGSDELARLLEPAGQIDLDGVPVRRVAVAQDMLPVGVGDDAQVEAEVEESITTPISIDDAPNYGPSEPNEPDAAELGTRGRRRVPSTPQPLSASELPPPPEHPRLADGEPEPMLETVDTGPIDLGTAEARAMIAAHSTRTPMMLEPEPVPEPEPEPVRTEITQVAPAPVRDIEDSDDADEFEIEDLEELDDEELELLDEEEEAQAHASDEQDESDAAPPSPPPPPSKPGGPPPAPASAMASDAASDNTDSFDIDVD